MYPAVPKISRKSWPKLQPPGKAAAFNLLFAKKVNDEKLPATNLLLYYTPAEVLFKGPDFYAKQKSIILRQKNYAKKNFCLKRWTLFTA